MACPSDDTFGRWLDGSLDDAAQRALLAHTETCGECRATAAQLQTLRSATLRSPSAPPSPVGSSALVGGKYRIDGAIGQGASAEVFAATDVQSGQQVALKMLHPNLRGDAVWSARFAREGRALANVRSRHVANVYEVGWTDDARPFLAMERIHGPSLEAMMESQGPAPAPRVVGQLLQICEALAAVHDAGIVHRDLKLANVLVCSRPGENDSLKVVDFGIARDVREAPGPALTPAQILLGTPHYMAPEQAQDPRNADARADVWALGVCAYRLLTGRYPFAGESAGQVLANVLEGSPTPLRSVRPDVPVALEAVVHRCLARDRNARYSDARGVALALALAADDGSTRRDVAVAPRARKRGPVFAISALVVTVAFLALGLAAGWLHRHL